MTLAEALDSGALSASRLRIPASLDTFGNPPDFDLAQARVLIVRLSTSQDVERSTPHLFLFGECRRALPGGFLDFAFLPTRRDRATLDAGSLPWFFGMASGRSAADFDLVLVSNSYSLELFNLPYLFTKTGLPLRASARRAAGIDAPLFVMGGSNASALGPIVDENGDSFVDGIFFGEAEGYAGTGTGDVDAEPAVPRIVRALLPDGATPASARLERAAFIGGFFSSPATVRSGKRVRVRIVGDSPLAPGERPVLNTGEASTVRVQISHGCPSFCSFCFEGWDRKPYREIGFDEILRRASRERVAHGADSFEAYSFNFNAYSEFPRLAIGLNRIFPRVDFMSQRTDILADDPGLAAFETAAGKRSFTIGIEGVSGRMRAYFRKSLPTASIMRALELVLEQKPRELKLFFILAGFENDGDLAEFSAFAKDFKQLRTSSGSGARTVFSFGRLVRLPFTPLALDAAVLDGHGWRRLVGPYKRAVETNGFEWRLAQAHDEFLVDQALASGDGRLVNALAEAASGGLLYDGTLSRGARKILSRSEGSRASAPLPFLDGAVRPDTLRRFHDDAMNFVDPGTCLGAECLACGACSPEQRTALERHRISRASRGETVSLTGLIAAKARAARIRFIVDLPDSLYGATGAFLSSWFLTNCFRADPGSERFILSSREVLFSNSGFFSKALPAFFGTTIFEIACMDATKAAATVMKAFPSGTPAGDGTWLPGRVELSLETLKASVATPALRTFLSRSGIGAVETSGATGRTWTVTKNGERRGGYSRLEVRSGECTGAVLLSCGRKADVGGLFDVLGVTTSLMAFRLGVAFPHPCFPPSR